uniref:Putative reverse transcriptase domain-containing protein n=1 Tax=Tanacetum cinerariifolium TaxID=118510 RepID=A0A699KSB9_TANCI|nr:putative reverse transcriptase domain-containing protein [Tanacetum cinerariifolium]
MKERLGQFVDHQMTDLMNNRRPRNRHREDEELEENSFGDGSSSDEQSIVRPRRNQWEDNRRWESGMRVNILNFDGDTLNPWGFVNWLAMVEEVFEFKEVPENKKRLRKTLTHVLELSSCIYLDDQAWEILNFDSAGMRL